MLFKTKFLELIREQKVQTAFRKWTRPTVKEGGTLMTPVGQLRIRSLKITEYKKITDTDITQAGYETRKELDKELSFKQEGTIYKIQFVLEQEDPRVGLRENDDISERELPELIEKLKKLDTSGQTKNWTLRILKAIDREPGRRAVDYATKLGYEKPWFKLNVRKLKNLGLTISLTDGYEISPRGKKLLSLMKKS